MLRRIAVSSLVSTRAGPAVMSSALALCSHRFCASKKPNRVAESLGLDDTPRAGSEGAAEDSHPDFKSKPNLSETSKDEIDAIKADIKETVETEDVVMFMKGVPEAPVCGFSKRMVDVLEEHGLEYTSFDALAHPVVRVYVKELSEWPTIPQLWVKGAFVGGVDIVAEMVGNGEFDALLTKHNIAHRKP